MTTLELTPPCDFINANGRLHHHAKAKLTKQWREHSAATWHEAAAESWALTPTPVRRAHVTVAIRFPHNRRRDVGNYYPTAKAILDGLVDAGVLEDDDDTRVVGPDMRRIYPNGTPLVRITIEEIP